MVPAYNDVVFYLMALSHTNIKDFSFASLKNIQEILRRIYILYRK